ncbi:hypothetical protein HY086_05080 [Candidatus Gottesmanbacteria bacterium]|nr:hypothetical protein [Candidatus Gottesmanbacteria bacterium]
MHTPAYWANPKPRADKGIAKYERLYRAAVDHLKGETPHYILPGDPFIEMGGIKRVFEKSAMIAYVWEVPGAEKSLAASNDAIYHLPHWGPDDAIALFSRFCSDVDPIEITSLNRQARAAERIILASLKV